jgi:hypothetical protein
MAVAKPSPQLFVILLFFLSWGTAQVIIRVGGGNCGGFGCDFGQFGLVDAVNASQDGDSIFMYGQLFINPDIPTPGGFEDTIITVNKSIGIAGIISASIQIIAPGTKGLNLFTLNAPNIEMAGFVINRQVVSGADNQPNVATIRFRSFFNGTSFPVHNIGIGGVVMTHDVPFGGTDVLFENGTFSDIAIEDGIFSAATGVSINETAIMNNIKISRNQFLWAAYHNLNPAAKALSAVDVRLNFWRPCPYRGPDLILPELGVEESDQWLPYCVSDSCDTPGPIATRTGGGGMRGWTSIQDALTSGQPDPLSVFVTAPFFMINTTQVIYRRVFLQSIVGDCVDACFANGTYPVVAVSNSSAATIAFTVLGDLLSMLNLQFELENSTRLALYRQATPYNAVSFTANRGALAFQGIAFTADATQNAALDHSLTSNFTQFPVTSTGGDMTLQNVQIVGGLQALLFWGPNMVGVVPPRELQVSALLCDGQSSFGVYLAGPTFTARFESNYFQGADFGLLAEKLSGMDVLRSQLILLGTGLALSQVTDSNLDCNMCVRVDNFCISVVTGSTGNVANWNTFAVPNADRFHRMPDNSNTLQVQESVNVGQVSPLLRIFQQFSATDFPYQFQGAPMFTNLQDVLLRHDTNSTTIGNQTAASSLFVKSTYLPTANLECYSYRDSLSSIYSAYSNVRSDCSIHKLTWDPFDNSTFSCSDLTPIVQAIPDDSWTQTGSSMSSGADCILQAQNRSQNVRFAVGTGMVRDAFVCAACSGNTSAFDNKTCDFTVDTFQEALEQVRISQLEDATILVNGICFVFDEEIDIEGLRIEGCGEAILSPTQGFTGGMAKKDMGLVEAEFQLHITVNFTTIQGITFEVVGDNTTYADDYCIIFIDGELLPIFNTTLFNNSFLQPNVDQLCTLMDTNTRVLQNNFEDGRRSVKASADSNEVVPAVSGINLYQENTFQNGVIHFFYSFLMPIRRPTQPYSRLQVIDNEFLYPRDVSLDILGINGRRSRRDLLFQGNRYTNPTPDPAACMGSMDPTICCEEDKECDTFAQRFVDSEDALFDNERYLGGAVMQMAGRNVHIQNSKWRDKSSATVGNTDIALLQNPFSPENVTMDNVEFAKDATIVCNLGQHFNPRTGQDSMLRVTNAIIDGQNIGVVKDDCDQTLTGIMTTDCRDRAGNTIFSARNIAPFAADEFIEPMTRVRTNCTPPMVFIPSQQGGTGTCSCEYLPEDQFIALVPFIPPLLARSRSTRQEEVNSQVRNCPTGQIHNPNNRSECIEGTATPSPSPSPTPTSEPKPPSPPSPSSSSSSSSELGHLWWIWLIVGGVILAVVIGVIIWACVRWHRKPAKHQSDENPGTPLTTFQSPTRPTPSVTQRTNRYGGGEENLVF